MAQYLTSPRENPERIRVLAADSTRMSSQLLAQALAQDSQFNVTGIDPKPSSILELWPMKRPHVVLMSSVLEESTTGFDLIRQVCAAHRDTRVVLLMDTSSVLPWWKRFVAGHKEFSPAPNHRKRWRSVFAAFITARSGRTAPSCVSCSKPCANRNPCAWWMRVENACSRSASRMWCAA